MSFRKSTLLIMFFLMTVSTANATISYITDDNICLYHCLPQSSYPVLRGHEFTITLVGQYVDLSTKVEVSGSGMYVNNIGTASGSKTVQLEVLDSASGTYTVKLRYLVELNGPDTFKVVVVQNGSIGRVTVPTLTQPFSDFDATIDGTNMSNITVFSADSDVGGPTTPDPSIVSTTSSTAKVNIHYKSGNVVRLNTKIRIADKAGGDACMRDRRYCYKLADGSTDVPISEVAPNFVSAAALNHSYSTLPKEGETLTFYITLIEAAKSGGEKVFWQLSPSSSFAAAAGSGTDFNPSVVNTVTVPAGNKSQSVIVVFKNAPDGCPVQGCVAQIQARIEPQPNFVVGEFRVTPVPLIPPRKLSTPINPIPPEQ
ncbi:MAG: hypothetical protein C5B55_02685 [Blastocatellia bacterium]|nr:MAG: hypothetical protein C5B55_02685 [Blastocatellia bacterium]